MKRFIEISKAGQGVISREEILDQRLTIVDWTTQFDSLSYLKKSDFTEGQLGEEVPAWFIGDGVYYPSHDNEFVCDETDYSFSYDIFSYKITAE
jgi:hypothetical protein